MLILFIKYFRKYSKGVNNRGKLSKSRLFLFKNYK